MAEDTQSKTQELVKKLRAGGKSTGKPGEEQTGQNLQNLLNQAADEIDRLAAQAKTSQDPAQSQGQAKQSTAPKQP